MQCAYYGTGSQKASSKINIPKQWLAQNMYVHLAYRHDVGQVRQIGLVRFHAGETVRVGTYALKPPILGAQARPLHGALNVGLRAAVCPYPHQALLHLCGEG